MPDLSEFGELNEVYDMGFGLGEGCPPTTLLVKKELQRKILYQLSPQEASIFTHFCRHVIYLLKVVLHNLNCSKFKK